MSRAEAKLVEAVLRLQLHKDGLAKLLADCEPCERERGSVADFAVNGQWAGVWMDNHGNPSKPGETVAPCWKNKVDWESDTLEAAHAGPDMPALRARLVAKEYCPSCQRNEVRIRAWYDGRRSTSGKVAAVTRLARRVAKERAGGKP